MDLWKSSSRRAILAPQPASRCHEYAPLPRDGSAQRFEQREPAWFQNEFSDVVQDPLLKTLTEIRFLGLHYKAFAETKSAGWLV